MRAILFTRRLDPAGLAADLAACVADVPWIGKPVRERAVGWSAIALHAQHGRHDCDAIHWHVPVDCAGECQPTPFLARCGHVRALLDDLPAPRLRVRFMRLAAGGRIGAHRDRHYGWDLPILRLHVPVLTHPAVEFRLAGARVDMRPGELWYLDTSREHEVDNRGDSERVHLVVDLVNGPDLRAALGPHVWERTLP